MDSRTLCAPSPRHGLVKNAHTEEQMIRGTTTTTPMPTAVVVVVAAAAAAILASPATTAAVVVVADRPPAAAVVVAGGSFAAPPPFPSRRLPFPPPPSSGFDRSFRPPFRSFRRSRTVASAAAASASAEAPTTTPPFSDRIGRSALTRAQGLAGVVARSVARGEREADDENGSGGGGDPNDERNTGGTGVLYGRKDLYSFGGGAGEEQRRGEGSGGGGGGNERAVVRALAALERDMQQLDNFAGRRPQLSNLELTLLSLSVAASFSGAFLFPDAPKMMEVLAPASAAFSASLGIGAEYVGKVAVADGKEVAAATIQCAAEAEGLLANAERAKAVTPLCVGVGATSASFALIAPVVVESLDVSGPQILTELYLVCPLVAVLAAAVASLAVQEMKSHARRAVSIGNRRFAKSGLIGRTWLSSTEQIEAKSASATAKWKSFATSVLPAPIAGGVVPGLNLPGKAIVVAALAAAQSAYLLAVAEHELARATDAVALKARSAAVADTYANQGARSAAILPFTSALSAFCAAATAAIVELPFLENLSSLSLLGNLPQAAVVSLFPTLSALFASAASVSKARCEVDAEAAATAAMTLALEYQGEEDDIDDPILNPFRGVMELIRLTIRGMLKTWKRSTLVREYLRPTWRKLTRSARRRRRSGGRFREGDNIQY